MQITDLNKVINLFLVGSMALAIMILLWIDSLQSYVFNRLSRGFQMPAALGVFVGTLLALSSAMFVGCVIDALTEVLFRSNMRRLVKIKPLRKIFWVEQSYEDVEVCREKFASLWQQNKKYRPLYDGNENSYQIFAAGFFHTAQPSNVGWVVQHHAVHVLAADYIFLVLIFTVILPIMHFAGSIFAVDVRTLPLGWWLLFLSSLYPLGHLAIDRWLYTYEAAYRHGMLVLTEHT